MSWSLLKRSSRYAAKGFSGLLASAASQRVCFSESGNAALIEAKRVNLWSNSRFENCSVMITSAFNIGGTVGGIKVLVCFLEGSWGRLQLFKAVKEGLSVGYEGDGIGLTGVLPGDQVLDCGSQGGGNTVCGYGIREAAVKVPPPESTKRRAYGGSKRFLGCFLLFYESVYIGPKGFGFHKEIIGKKSPYL
jgi:hypothetical protein